MNEAEGHPHLDPLVLDALRAGVAPDGEGAVRDGSPRDRAHLESCAACRQALADLEALALAVRRAAPRPTPVPPAVDWAILEMGRARAGEQPKTIHKPIFALLRTKAFQVAASVLISTAIAFLAVRALRLDRRLPPELASRGVDIVDAYSLALRLRTGAPLGRSWDLNGDGAVDGLDVEWIAQRSVSLGKGGGR